ncbi:MAG: 30S ribosomal protein S17 [Patescibacteria group bacterium]|jgi:small subunit ribosomal protein S17
MNTQTSNNKRILAGTVVSTKMDKTIAVKVDRVLVHPKYGKRYNTSKKYLVAAPNKEYKEGDKVEFVECRPLSKLKRWRVITKPKK